MISKNPIITVFYPSLWGIAKLVPRWGFVELDHQMVESDVLFNLVAVMVFVLR